MKGFYDFYYDDGADNICAKGGIALRTADNPFDNPAEFTDFGNKRFSIYVTYTVTGEEPPSPPADNNKYIITDAYGNELSLGVDKYAVDAETY